LPFLTAAVANFGERLCGNMRRHQSGRGEATANQAKTPHRPAMLAECGVVNCCNNIYVANNNRASRGV
jgi:hypothetical protein